jgi:peptide/nickel transport system ATP-binding protein
MTTAANSVGAKQPDGVGPILSVSNLQAYFRTSHFGVHRTVRAVDGISFDVGRGEIYGLAGESSSGKTTLVRTIAGAIKPPLEVVGGTAEFSFLPGFGGLHRAPAAEVARIRWRHLSYIMQGSMNVLNPVRRLRQSFVDFARPHMAGTERKFEQAVIDHLARVNLDASVLAAYPHELSGGMRQRVTIALATICRPDFIIADEPTTALDVTIQGQILFEMQKLSRETGAALIWITHDLSVIAGLADRICVMYAGRIVEEGTTADVLTTPRHPYTRGLLDSVPANTLPQERLRQIPGMTPSLLELGPGCAFRSRCPRAQADCEQDPEMRPYGAVGQAIRCFHPLEAP